MKRYLAPTDLQQLLEMLETAEDPIIIAGGQSLLPALRERSIRSGTLIDLEHVPELRKAVMSEDGAVIGAGVVMAELMRGALAAAYPALAAAAGSVGNQVIRGRSTVGGSLAWANPVAEMPMIMMAHQALVRTQYREFPVRDLMTRAFTTILDEREVILSVSLPRPQTMVFDEIIPRNSTGRAIVSVACAKRDDAAIITLAGLTERPLDELVLTRGEGLTIDRLRSAIDHLAPSDHFTSLDYRLAAACVLIRRCRERLEAL